MSRNNYNLENRTVSFAESLVSFLKGIPLNPINQPLISQLIRSGTSIGANYYEANNASSKKDFANKIFLCKKESNETKFWLRLLAKSNPEKINECRKFWQEAKELTLIFSKINLTIKKNSK